MSSRVAATSIALFVFCTLGSPAPARAQAPAQPPAQPPTPAPAAARGPERVAVIDMQGAIAGCSDGQRDLGALAKKFEPGRARLQQMGAELQGLQRQLSTQGATMTPAARDTLVKSIDTKTKTLQRTAEDTENDLQQQQNEIAKRILAKLAPVLKKYAGDHGYGLVIDGSMPWPQGPVVMVADTMDITKAVIEAYDAQASAPAPPKK